MKHIIFSAIHNHSNLAHILSFADSAACEHYFVDCSNFLDYTPLLHSGVVAAGLGFCILGTGKVLKHTYANRHQFDITFNDALHAPDFSQNLILIGVIDKKGCAVKFGGRKAIFVYRNRVEFIVGKAMGMMYQLELLNLGLLANVAHSLLRAANLETWHC